VCEESIVTKTNDSDLCLEVVWGHVNQKSLLPAVPATTAGCPVIV